jgi:hypothetical protein
VPTISLIFLLVVSSFIEVPLTDSVFMFILGGIIFVQYMFIGMIEKTKKFEVVIDEELAESAQTYVDYCRKLALRLDTADWISEEFTPGAGGFARIEQRYTLSALDPPFDSGGTCDFIVAYGKTLEVVDLKNGQGIVDVNENKQTRSYALMALLNIDPRMAAEIDMIKSTIVQPRAPHKDGRIRSETFHVADLIEWTHELLKRMHRSRQALDEFERINGNRVLFDEWAEKWLTPGSCKFCPAEALCPARRKQALKIAGETAVQWFEDPMAEETPKLNAPALMSPEELAHMLDGLDALEDWVKSIRAHAHRSAENGVKLPGYQLVDKIGNRAWKDEKNVAAILRAEVGIPEEKIYLRKLKSPAQIEAAIPKADHNKIAGLWEKPVKGTNLVAVDKTTRPPAKSKTETFFEEIKE